MAEFLHGEERFLWDNLILAPTDGTTLTSLSKDNTFQPRLVSLAGSSQDYPDSQNWLGVVWTCDATFAQRVGYCNEKFDRLTDMGDTAVDPAERLGYYEEAGQILISNVLGSSS